MRTAAAALLACASGALVAADPWVTVDKTLVNHLDNVTVSFGGLDPADVPYAWLGLFAPANASTAAIDPLPYPASGPWVAAHPVEYMMVPAITGSQSQTEGNHTATLVNMYVDMRFVLFVNGTGAPVAVASTEAISFRSMPPLRGHLALVGSDPASVRVTWNSPRSASQEVPTVKWGIASGKYSGSVVAQHSRTYEQAQMCGDPAGSQGWFTPHYWHSAVVAGLPFNTRVYYVYGSASGGWSAEASFMTGSPVSPTSNANFLLSADIGMTTFDGSTDHWAETPAWTTTRNLIGQLDGNAAYHAALIVGDLSYATGAETKWYLFDTRMSMLSSRVPLMVGIGNHEQAWLTGPGTYKVADSGGECGIPTLTRYPMPWGDDIPTALNASWYTFNQGPVAVIMLNSELPVAPGSPQAAWYEATLAAIDRTATPWVVTAFHRPMYSGATYDPILNKLEPLMIKYQVDLVLTGHVHNSFVTCPVANGTCVQATTPGGYDAPVHVVIGNAGQNLTPPDPRVAPWIAHQKAEYGYATLAVQGATAMTLTIYEDVTNTVSYAFTINRAYPRSV